MTIFKKYKRMLKPLHTNIKNNILKVTKLNKSKNVLPKKFTYDLRYRYPIIYDQLQVGSCTSNAGAGFYGSLSYNDLTNKVTSFRPSRNFMYYNNRLNLQKILNSYIKDLLNINTNFNLIDLDCGAESENVIFSLLNGVCDESLDTYPNNADSDKDFKKFQYITDEMIQESQNHKLISNTNEDIPQNFPSILSYIGQYYRIPLIKENLINVLKNNNPILCGIAVDQTLMNKNIAKTGKWFNPNNKISGSHEVLIEGYDINSDIWILKNSWSDKWGDNGYFYTNSDVLFNQHFLLDAFSANKTTDTNK